MDWSRGNVPRGSVEAKSHHHQSARGASAFPRETPPQVFDDLIAEGLATGAPPPGPGQGFDAPPQSAKAENLGRFAEFAADGIAERGEKDQLAALLREGAWMGLTV